MKAITLLYHDVIENDRPESSGFSKPGMPLYKIKIGDFKKHLGAIAKIVKDKPVNSFKLSDGKKAETPLLLTFDDGGLSAYTCVADILDGLGWRGHFLVISDYIGAPAFLNKQHIRELRKRGHAIGVHSRSHPERMSYLSTERLKEEWATSVKKLSDILGERIEIASIPEGYYSKRVAETAVLAGIKILFTSEPTMKCHYANGCMVVGRYTVYRGMSPAAIGGIASGRLGPRLRQFFFWNLKKTAKFLSGEAYSRTRRNILESVKMPDDEKK